MPSDGKSSRGLWPGELKMGMVNWRYWATNFFGIQFSTRLGSHPFPYSTHMCTLYSTVNWSLPSDLL
jgi:hypothetical protein